MNPDRGNPIKRKEIPPIPDKVREAIYQAIKADIAAGKRSGTVVIENPECVTYPCTCGNGKYCCACIPTENGACIHFCQTNCFNFNYDVCGDDPLYYNCNSTTNCVACCESMNYHCDYDG